MGRGIQSCAAVGCPYNYDNSSYSFFLFPRDATRARKWAIASGREDLLELAGKPLRKVLCSTHFENRMFVNAQHNRIHRWAIPTIFPENQGPSTCTGRCETVARKIKQEPFTQESETHLEEIFTENSVVTITTVSQSSEATHTLSKHVQTPAAWLTNLGANEKLRDSLKNSRIKCDNLERQVEKLKRAEKTNAGQITFDEYKLLTLKYCPSQELAYCINAILTQIKKKPQGRRFSKEFKNFCLSLYFLGPRLYKNELVDKLGLPCIRTLQRFIGNFKITAGLNDVAFESLQGKVDNFSNAERFCALCFDTCDLKPNLFYATDLDKIFGFEDLGEGQVKFKPATKVIVVMVRGIVSDWEQPLAYFFVNSVCPAKKLNQLLRNAISRLTYIGLKVTAVVSNLDANNVRLSEILGVTPENPYFIQNNRKIVYMFDTPSLLSSLRKNMIQYQFEIEGQIVSWEYIEAFYTHDQLYPVRAAPKLTDAHFDSSTTGQAEFDYASQIFSNAVARALNLYIRFQELPQKASATQGFIENINNLFDMLNSSQRNGPTTFQNAYRGAKDQESFLQECYKMFDNLAILNYQEDDASDVVRCVQGWKTTISAVNHLWDILKTDGVKYLFTRRTQLDCLRKFFECVKQQNGNCAKRTPIQFVRAFRKLFCESVMNPGTESSEENVAEMVRKLADIPTVSEKTETSAENEQWNIPIDNEYRSSELLQNDFFKHIPEFVMEKCSVQHNCGMCEEHRQQSSDAKNTSLDFYLLTNSEVPENDYTRFLLSLEVIFRENFEQLATREHIVKNFVNLFEQVQFGHPCPDFPVSYLRKLYARARIYYTVQDIQKNLKNFSAGSEDIIWQRS